MGCQPGSAAPAGFFRRPVGWRAAHRSLCGCPVAGTVRRGCPSSYEILFPLGPADGVRLRPVALLLLPAPAPSPAIIIGIVPLPRRGIAWEARDSRAGRGPPNPVAPGPGRVHLNLSRPVRL